MSTLRSYSGFSSFMTAREPHYRIVQQGTATTTASSPAASVPIFEQLADAYIQATSWMSSADQFRTTAAYKAIVNLGDIAVPLILKRMQSAPLPEHWFPLLSQITGDDPVAQNHVGIVEHMKNDWLTWGQQRGLL